MARGELLPTSPGLVFQGWQRLQDLRSLGLIEYQIVSANFSVSEDNDAFCELRYVLFVGNQNNRQPFLV
jgi:hypothetical protein